MKNHKLKYQASRRIAALKKMCAMILAWVCKMVCKDTPVLMANNNYQVNFGNTAKAMAVAASMPIVAVPIQDVQLLDYAVAHETVNATYGMTASTDDDIYRGLMDKDPYTSDQQRERDEYQLDNENWNEVVFEEVLGGSTAKLALHNDWINQKGYQVDAVVEMNLPEQGISGPFRITSIKHIIPQKKPIDDDEGDEYRYRPVTALFTHESNQVFNISFDNGEKLGVTYQHPIYSTTAGDWKLAGELEIGEEVLTKSGNTKVVSSTKKDGSETVYNLEVKELHNFLVGESGVVVHNSCNPDEVRDYVTGYISQFKNLPNGKLRDAVEELTYLRNRSGMKFRKFLNDFGDKIPLAKLGGGGVKAWEKLASLGDTPSKSWMRTQIPLLERMVAKEADFPMDNVKSYYSRHNSNADINSYPGTSSTGQYYDEFGHPDFTNDVPIAANGNRPVYQPTNGIKGSNTDLTDANNWALKPVSEGGGGFDASNFRRKGTKCEIKDQTTGNWVECTWHHHQDGKTLIPVPSEIHSRANAAHIGGVQAYNDGIIGFFDSPVF